MRKEDSSYAAIFPKKNDKKDCYDPDTILCDMSFSQYINTAADDEMNSTVQKDGKKPNAVIRLQD